MSIVINLPVIVINLPVITIRTLKRFLPRVNQFMIFQFAILNLMKKIKYSQIDSFEQQEKTFATVFPQYLHLAALNLSPVCVVSCFIKYLYQVSSVKYQVSAEKNECLKGEFKHRKGQDQHSIII